MQLKKRFSFILSFRKFGDLVGFGRDIAKMLALYGAGF